jgi:prepilin-type N-terminal cleavage/methylation domain-containing protein
MNALMNRLREAKRVGRDDSGFTLVEMLVALIMSAILGSILLAMLLGAQRSTKSTTTTDDLNGEGRTALNRIARDLRQAVPVYDTSSVETPAIVSVQNPDGPGHVDGAVTSVTFDADFNGDGCITGLSVQTQPIVGSTATSCLPSSVDNSNPEVVTYCWYGSGSGSDQIFLIPGTVNPGTNCQPTTFTGQPLVSGRITDFRLSYRSTQYRYDGACPSTNPDGTIYWYELDCAGSPVGNDNQTLDTPELDYVSSVMINVTVAGGGHTQSYQTQVDLRNVT